MAAWNDLSDVHPRESGIQWLRMVRSMTTPGLLLQAATVGLRNRFGSSHCSVTEQTSRRFGSGSSKRHALTRTGMPR